MKQMVLSALFLAACSSTGKLEESSGALTASSAANEFGVNSYVVDSAGSITARDRSGARVAQIVIEDASETKRLVTFAYADETREEFEIFRPLKDGSFKVSAERDRAGAIQSDP